MPRFSTRSKQRLATCDEQLQVLFNEVVKHFDCTIIEGYRSRQRQNQAYDAGRSKLKYPQSKHNRKPSLAVDVAPYPIDWKDIGRFLVFGGYVMATAKQLGMPIRWGGDWNGNWDLTDQMLFDYPHFELMS
jgi:peptidoglycan LD-endopeptidase CwlK